MFLLLLKFSYITQVQVRIVETTNCTKFKFYLNLSFNNINNNEIKNLSALDFIENFFFIKKIEYIKFVYFFSFNSQCCF